MKKLFYLFIGVFLFSCQKENTDLGAEYQYIIGEWEGLPTESGSTVFASFKKNGKVVVETEAQRGLKMKLEEESVRKDQFYNNVWMLYFEYSSKNQESLFLSKKEGATDTIYIYTVFTKSDTLKGTLVPLIRKK